MVGGDKTAIEGIVKPMILGEYPLARETLWNWMDQTITSSPQALRGRHGRGGQRAVRLSLQDGAALNLYVPLLPVYAPSLGATLSMVQPLLVRRPRS